MKKTILCLSLFLLAGCLSPKTSPTPKYYQLQASDDMGRSQKEFNKSFLIVGPVGISPYLDKPQFALRSNNLEVQYLDYERWVEPISVNISTVVASNLREYFQTPNISQGAPKLAIQRKQPRILILINRMDVTPEGNALLDVQWALNELDASKDPVIHEAVYTTDIKSTDMLDRIAALNKLVTEFSKALAESIENEM